MKTLTQWKATAALVAVIALPTANVLAADVSASGVVAKVPAKTASAAVQGQVRLNGKVQATTGAVVGKQGDNQYPSGTIITPPKPKKDGPEAAAVISVQGGENQYPSGTIITPPKPKKDGPEAAAAAAALKAKAAQP